MSINAWGSDDPAEVAKGGTGNSTLTDHGILLGSGTSPVTVSAAPTNGQLLIGSTGADPALAVPTGDTNEIAITSGAGTLAVGIADNAVLPGTGSYTWVDGTTAQEPAGANGEARYDTTTDMFRGYVGGSWQDFITTATEGCWKYLAVATTGSVSSVVFDSTYITSAYKTYIVEWTAVLPSASGPYPNWVLQFSPDNGSTWRTTGYSSGAITVTAGAASYANVTTDIRFAAKTCRSLQTGWAIISNLDDAVLLSSAYMMGNHGDSTDVYGVSQGGGIYKTTESHNAIRFLFDSGNVLFSGLTLYGLKYAHS